MWVSKTHICILICVVPYALAVYEYLCKNKFNSGFHCDDTTQTTATTQGTVYEHHGDQIHHTQSLTLRYSVVELRKVQYGPRKANGNKNGSIHTHNIDKPYLRTNYFILKYEHRYLLLF